MMSEFDEKLGAILGDADAMGRIMDLARSLSMPKDTADETVTPPQPTGETGRDVRLLSALRPYLRPERQVRVDRTLEMLSMIRVLRGLK